MEEVEQPAKAKDRAVDCKREPQTADARVVATRTQFRVTLLPGSVPNAGVPAATDGAVGSLDGRGWSSPHGEPYRPLGKPDLSLKFTPRLADGSSLLQNAQRMRVFEGNHQHQPGSASGPSSAKEKEVREASGTGEKDSSAQKGKPDLFDLFPFNISNNRKRVLDERQVKFAYRLHESMASYSPEKIRSLQRRIGPPSPSRFCTEPSGLQSSPSSDSFQMLKEALHDCSSRLRLVRNGACFLQQLPPDDIPTLHELQHTYYEERVKALENRVVAPGATRLGSTRSVNASVIPTPIAASDESAQPNIIDESRTYLPYTTRHAQHSPHRHLPSLDEVRVKVREEKLQMPVRPLRSASHDISGQMVSRRPSGRPSRLGSTISTGSRPSVLSEQSGESGMRPTRPSMLGNDSQGNNSHNRHASNIAAIAATPVRINGNEKASTQTKIQQASPVKLHSVEKLQAAVSSLEEVKLKRSVDLAQSIEALNQDRRECLSLKFKSFNVEHHIDDDMFAMRKRSEMQRIFQFEQIVDHVHWYDGLLRKLLSREGTGPPLHPAEVFVVNAIRQLTHEGREFDSLMLFQVILSIHREDLLVSVVQDLLIYLRDALGIHQDDWSAFFQDHEFNLPVEKSNERKEAEPEPRVHRLNSKLRAVVKASQLLRHLSAKE